MAQISEGIEENIFGPNESDLLFLKHVLNAVTSWLRVECPRKTLGHIQDSHYKGCDCPSKRLTTGNLGLKMILERLLELPPNRS